MRGSSGFSELARGYHGELDAKISKAVAALGGRDVKIPCVPGCAWCCRLPVHATAPEGALAAEYILERLDGAEAKRLAGRMSAWLKWGEAELPVLAEAGIDYASAWLKHGPGCPFLQDGLCAIYPARPMGCRAHFATDGPEGCTPDARRSVFSGPGTVIEVLDAVKPVCMEYRRKLEERGYDFGRMVRPLPELVLKYLVRP